MILPVLQRYGPFAERRAAFVDPDTDTYECFRVLKNVALQMDQKRIKFYVYQESKGYKTLLYFLLENSGVYLLSMDGTHVCASEGLKTVAKAVEHGLESDLIWPWQDPPAGMFPSSLPTQEDAKNQILDLLSQS